MPGDSEAENCDGRIAFLVLRDSLPLSKYMDVAKNRGGPPKWMVKIMEHPIKMDDLGLGNTHISRVVLPKSDLEVG